MFKKIKDKIDFPKMEEEILDFWKKNDVFKSSLKLREKGEIFSFYDGPPFATGLPHFGNFVPNIIKDIIPRYQTMKGKYVERRFGWDTHGLPIEYEIEKKLGIFGKYEIEKFGVEKFNRECRETVLKYSKEWRQVITRLGRWVDFENDYKTMDIDFMESVWWVFKKLHDEKLIYEGFYILPYSPLLSSPLSNFEVNLGEYREVNDPAVTVKVKLKNKAAFLLIWTTTPWTLPSNLAIAVGGEIDYVEIEERVSGEHYILGLEALNHYYKEAESFKIINKFKGKDLENEEYEPIFDYFKGESERGGFKIYLSSHVKTDEGTGLVHIAPFGEEDYLLLKEKTNVEIVCPIDLECKFTSEVSDFQGKFVKDADRDIINFLKRKGTLFKRENYLHRYPFCYRTGAPIIYRPVRSWFLSIEKIKEDLIKVNKNINWIPSHIQKGRFGKWLENAKDWAISRNRFWGNPIPVWKCNKCNNEICIGSREELFKYSSIKADDLHKDIIDKITWSCDCGGTYIRTEEVLDCWFESGAMPYAQNGYPFKNRELFEKSFPANFISEGLDQTRGWFYTLTVLSAALFKSHAFSNVIVNGLVLANDGKKMSKSLKNYTDPMSVINSFGADALRLYLVMSPLVKAENLKYNDEGVRDVLKSIIIPLWNSYSFFITYATIDNYYPGESLKREKTNNLDKWIISECESLNKMLDKNLNEYNLSAAIELIAYFIDKVNNWYIRRSRRRFWKSENDEDKKAAYDTLYYVLKKFITLSSPIIPFITEEIYQNLKLKSDPLSVHLEDYPAPREEFIEEELEEKTNIVKQVVSMARSLRTAHSIKIRQPLSSLYIITRDEKVREALNEMLSIIKSEINVKEIFIQDNEEELLSYSAKVNYKVMGRVLGSLIKDFERAVESLESGEIAKILEGERRVFKIAGRDIEVNKESILIKRHERANFKIINFKEITLALDSKITESLYIEGLSRELVRNIQNLRKNKDFNVSDKIKLFYRKNEILDKILKEHKTYIKSEILATELSENDLKASEEFIIDEGINIFLDIEKN